jgi:hypothetical protein
MHRTITDMRLANRQSSMKFFSCFGEYFGFFTMDEQIVEYRRSPQKVELSVHLDSQLVDQVNHLTNDPSKVIEAALRQWLRGELKQDEDLTRNLLRNPPVPPRGEWND